MRQDYNFQSHARWQKPSKDMESYGDSLMELAENAYSNAIYSFKVQLTWHGFMQGLSVSDELRERLFMSQPGSLVEAIRVVQQLESAHKASNYFLSCTTSLLVVWAVLKRQAVLRNYCWFLGYEEERF